MATMFQISTMSMSISAGHVISFAPPAQVRKWTTAFPVEGIGPLTEQPVLAITEQKLTESATVHAMIRAACSAMPIQLCAKFAKAPSFSVDLDAFAGQGSITT